MPCNEKTRLEAGEKLEFLGRVDLVGLDEKKIEIDTKV
jgi:predicted RNA-binding protein